VIAHEMWKMNLKEVAKKAERRRRKWRRGGEREEEEKSMTASNLKGATRKHRFVLPHVRKMMQGCTHHEYTSLSRQKKKLVTLIGSPTVPGKMGQSVDFSTPSDWFPNSTRKDCTKSLQHWKN
jgi:hypothetical protein